MTQRELVMNQKIRKDFLVKTGNLLRGHKVFRSQAKNKRKENEIKNIKGIFLYDEACVAIASKQICI